MAVSGYLRPDTLQQVIFPRDEFHHRGRVRAEEQHRVQPRPERFPPPLDRIRVVRAPSRPRLGREFDGGDLRLFRVVRGGQFLLQRLELAVALECFLLPLRPVDNNLVRGVFVAALVRLSRRLATDITD